MLSSISASGDTGEVDVLLVVDKGKGKAKIELPGDNLQENNEETNKSDRETGSDNKKDVVDLEASVGEDSNLSEGDDEENNEYEIGLLQKRIFSKGLMVKGDRNTTTDHLYHAHVLCKYSKLKKYKSDPSHATSTLQPSTML
ncbi:hypothetical protein FA15DRAFT_658301 [Coprinopsis marcescibilis]|uniref:Uncharacterized protein n=1 Tax=Coprinopsis marcescibilis TaxID=230819 RepID=A0A5C3KMY1_COPMA|nr:hypothetical protein FA15DRAFT_658301 [Coprinopsis marcescibilis]